MPEQQVIDTEAPPRPRRRRVPRPISPVSTRPISLGFGTRAVQPRSRRPRATWAIFLGGLLALLAGGYLLLMRHVDPQSARREILGELGSLPLEAGERVQGTAFVYARSPWDYFRSSHGVVAATDRRLIVLTMAPTDRFAREIERPVIERREFPKDTTLHVSTGRAMLGLSRAVTFRAPGTRARYEVFSSDWTRLQGLLGNVKHRQDSIYAAAAEAARQRAVLAEVMRQPIWYRIRRGDAVTSIAQRFNTTPERLREINHLANDRIRVNDSIMIKPPTR